MKTKLANRLPMVISTLAVVLLPLLFITCTCESEVPTQEEAKSAVMEKIQAANAAWASGETMGFLKNAAEDIVWIDDIGPSKRLVGRDALKSYLEGLKGVVPSHKHELFDFKFQFYGDIVIVSYYYQGIIEGVKPPPWKAVSIYKYSDGDWFSVHENWTEKVVEKPKEASEEVKD